MDSETSSSIFEKPKLSIEIYDCLMVPKNKRTHSSAITECELCGIAFIISGGEGATQEIRT